MRGKVLFLTAFLALFLVLPTLLTASVVSSPKTARAQDGGCPDSTNPLCDNYVAPDSGYSAPSTDEQWNSDGTITSGGVVVGNYDPSSGGGVSYYNGSGDGQVSVEQTPTAPDPTANANPCANGDVYDAATGGCVSSKVANINGTICPTGQTAYYDPSTGMTDCKSNQTIATQVNGTKCPTGQTAVFDNTTGQTVCQGASTSGTAKTPTSAPGSGNIANLVCGGGLGSLISLVATACKAYQKVAGYITPTKTNTIVDKGSGTAGNNPAATPTPSATAPAPTPITQGTAKAGATAFSTLGAGVIYPPCLRGDAAQNAGLNCVGESITYYTSALLFLIGLGSFIFMLYGAFQYTTAFGDEAKVTQGRNTIKNAIIGVLLASLAYFIVAVIKKLLNA